MKIVHIPFCFYPDAVGGTEIYVRSLAGEQQRDGHEVLICAPSSTDSSYLHQGLRVRRFAVDESLRDVADSYGEGDERAATRFGEILDEEQPDIVHLHALTRGASPRLIREAKSRGIATIFSYHTPTVSCVRGTLLRDGAKACAGLLDVPTCTSCNLNSLGAPHPVAAALGLLPPGVSRVIGQRIPAGRVATAFRMSELVELRHSAFRAIMREVDFVVALCEWTRDLLVLNGVPAGKIILSRQGVPAQLSHESPAAQPASALRIVFLGRMAPEKGLPVLIRALRAIPAANVTLDIYGSLQPLFVSSQTTLIEDKRISFRGLLARQDLLGTLRQYDVVAVPSQWLETGPMVVMEAFAAGIPVIGSRLGGIAELVRHDVDGLLIEASSVRDWAAAISDLASDRSLLRRLRAGIVRQHTTWEVAKEIDEVYAQVIPQYGRSMAAAR